MAHRYDPTDPVSDGFRADITSALDLFLAQLDPHPATIEPGLGRLTEFLRDYLSGGKRLRASFGYWGHLAVTEPADPEALLRAVCSFELLHASALIHDDLIDGSQLRRGQPALQVVLQRWHEGQGGSGSAESFGQNAAILAGDLLAAWATQIVDDAGLSEVALQRARLYLHAMRTEVNLGQYLDLLAEHGLASGDAATVAQRVAGLKTSAYTVRRPLGFGAAIAGASPNIQTALSDFGLYLGLAFQYRDDLLGVFGDAAVTGKPAGDDLREGKRTMLIAEASADPAGAELSRFLGRGDLDEAGVQTAQALITASGAPQRVEQRIAELLDRAVESLNAIELTTEGRTALTTLARLCTRRDH